jgi:Methyltransferase domain
VIPPLTITAWLRWDQVRRLLPRDATTVLEIGAGLGGTGVMLARRYVYVGLEPDFASHSVASRRLPTEVRRERVEDHHGVYDLVCAFEVLEHVERDIEALKLWRERSNDWLLLSVPANPGRFGPGDEYVGHYRRYTRESLAAALTEAGWSVHAIHAYGFPGANLLEAVRNRLARQSSAAAGMAERTGGSGRWLQPRQAFAPVTWLFALPFRAAQRPFVSGARGTGLIALARHKPDTALA